MTESIAVGLGQRMYDVHLGAGMLAQAGTLLRPLLKRPRLAIVADATVWNLHGEMFAHSLHKAGIAYNVIEIPPGEASKSFVGLEHVIEALLQLKLERADMIIAFGGGVTGDLTGFAAGVIKRGIDFVQIPTTLLAQVDSSVGGKTAINTAAGKNLVGLFWQPRMVLADLDVLATLPDRDRRAGWSEILKIGLLGDRAFFDWCRAHTTAALAGDQPRLAYAIGQSIRAKARIVEQDEKEVGVRALLNLGHSFAHAFETCVGFDEAIVRHGEAVGCGLAMAFRFSAQLGLIAQQDVHLVEQAIEASGLAAFPANLASGAWDPLALFEAMTHDKKNENGALTLVLVRAIGEAFVQKGVDSNTVQAFIQEDVKR
ncbi:3-dehydroquinate synthase [Candidatus Phycosocius spiralis]|uniref:3-dehydroquinate synthase n=1 Tax=Candidatus Phycosocius spiralis TaxID=2815099 RepID=A0ABQ4PTP9_9PROT|nr:3-dehydroquinate synthase [Candidatus Phycosocius spiralis]GIU66357.1 3-dehydroquinate synthase [Candidatus Phycosocius spiralis]